MNRLDLNCFVSNRPYFSCMSLIAAASSLQAAAFILSRRIPSFYNRAVYQSVVVAPIFEETVMRGIFQPAIRLVQRRWNLHPEDARTKRIEQVVRIQLSALVFALTHLVKEGSFLMRMRIAGWAYTGGLVYAHLSEKTNSLALPIFLHGLNNALALTTFFFPSPLTYASLIGLRVALCAYIIFDSNRHHIAGFLKIT